MSEPLRPAQGGLGETIVERTPTSVSPGPGGPAYSASLRWTRQTWSGVLALLVIHSLLLGWLAAVYSPTYDEPGHLAAGYRIWTMGAADLYIVNPPLVKTMAAWPLLFLQPKTNWERVIDSSKPTLTGHDIAFHSPRTWAERDRFPAARL